MLGVAMLNVTLLSVIILSVMAPPPYTRSQNYLWNRLKMFQSPTCGQV
jgi:hypothetical protein